MISVRFQGKPFNIAVIQVYAPTNNVEKAEVEQFYEDLQDLLELKPKKDILFIIGDWNAKVGSQETPGIIGKFGLGIWNEAVQFSSVQSLSRVQLPATPGITACQASLSITNSRSSLRLTSIESVMPSSHLLLCRPFLLLPPIPPSIRVFSNESTLRMRWPKYWSFSFSISPSKEIPGLIFFRMDWLDLLEVQGTLKSLLNTTVQKHQFFSAQPSSQSNSHIYT